MQAIIHNTCYKQTFLPFNMPATFQNLSTAINFPATSSWA